MIRINVKIKKFYLDLVVSLFQHRLSVTTQTLDRFVL